MKHKKMVGVLLLSIAILAGCSNNKKEATTAKSSRIEKSSKKVASSEKASKKSESSEVSTVTPDPSQSQATTSEQATSQSQPAVIEQDLNPDAISKGDFSTLVGSWQNEQGDAITFSADGTVVQTSADGSTYSPKLIPLADDGTQKIPRADLKYAVTGAFLAMYKIGVANPDGDQSDMSKPRLIIGQQPTNYPANIYYYRK